MQSTSEPKKYLNLAIKIFLIAICLTSADLSFGQSDVLLQAYYWDVPVDSEHKNGTWYDSINAKIPYLNKIGIQSIWLPPPSKGNWGIYDSGYGVYDHYDIGSYNQIGTVETRYGSEQELKNLIAKAKKHKIKVIADVVLNHMYSSQFKDLEYNPVLTNYTADGSKAYYPVNEIIWQLKLEQKGVYYFKVTTDNLLSQEDWNGGFELKLLENLDLIPDKGSTGFLNSSKPKSEPLTINSFFISKLNSKEDSKWFHINVAKKGTYFLKVKLGNLKKTKLEYANQSHSLKIESETFYKNAKKDFIQALTFTGIYPQSQLNEHKGSWNYQSYHPSSDQDKLAIMPDGELVPNAKIFGHDFNHTNPYVEKRLINWGNWLLDSVGYEGVRLDFVQGIDPVFIANWFKNVPKRNGLNFFIVGEYFSHKKDRIKSWADQVALLSEMKNIKVFDFPLKFELTKMCNSDDSYDMRNLNKAGLLLDPVHNLSAKNIVSFVENHDTGKESDKWIRQNWLMAYAFIMMAPPQVCVYYNHLFPTNYIEMNDHSVIQKISTDLPKDIIRLIKIREKFVSDNQYQVLSNDQLQFKNVFVSYLKGKSKHGLFLVLNNSEESKRVKLKVSDSIKEDINEVSLTNVFGKHNVTLIDQNGFIEFSVKPNGISIWVAESEKIQE